MASLLSPFQKHWKEGFMISRAQGRKNQGISYKRELYLLSIDGLQYENLKFKVTNSCNFY